MRDEPLTLPRQFQSLDLRAVVIIVALCAAWGFYQTTVKIAIPDISPVMQSGLRSIGSTILLVVWCGYRQVPLLRADGTLWPGVAAGILFGSEFLLIYKGLTYTDVARSILFIYTAPFFVALGAHFLLRDDRLSLIKLVGLIAAFGGVALVFRDGMSVGRPEQLTGDLMCLAAGIIWAATTLLIRASSLVRIRAEKILFYQLAVSAVMLPPAAWIMGEPGVVNLSWAAVLALAYQIVVVAFATYAIWFWLITRYPPSKVSAFTFLTPVFGVMFGNLILDERATPILLAALLLIAGGIYLVNRPERRRS